MSTFTIGKVLSALPGTLVANRMYAVRVGEGFDLYLADSTGSIAYKLNSSGGTAPSVMLTTSPTASVGDTTARISFRAEAAATVAVRYSTVADLSGGTTTPGVAVDDTTDFTGKVDLSGLPEDTPHYYTLLVNGEDQFVAPYPQLKTFPANGSAVAISGVIGACTRHDASIGADTIFAAVPLDVRFLAHLGDTVYADLDTPNATTLANYRTLHRNALSGLDATTENWMALRKRAPVFTMWDDHDLVNDFSAGTGSALYAPAKQAFREYHGRANPDGPTAGELYYSYQIGNVGFFVPDERSFRSPNSSTDNSSKTMLGATQLAALKAWLLASKDTLVFKIILSEVPMSGYAWTTAGDSWGGVDDGKQVPTGANGFRTERNALWDFIDENQISGVLAFSGDQHWAAMFKTTYAGRPRYEGMSSPFNNTNLTPDPSTAADPVNGPIFWKYGAGKNMGVFTADTTVSPPTISFQLYGPAGSLGSSYLTTLTLDDIDAGLVPEVLPLALTGTLPAATVGSEWVGVMGFSGDYTGALTIDASAGTIPAWMGTPAIDYTAKTITWGPVTLEAGTDSGSPYVFTPRATDSDGQPAIGPEQSVAVNVASEGWAKIGGTPFHNPTTVSLPSGCQAGDICVIALASTLVNTTTAPGSATQTVPVTLFAGSTNAEQWTYRLTSTDITNGYIAFSANHAFGALAVFRGAATTGTLDVAPTIRGYPSAASGTPVPLSAPSITTTGANRLIVYTAWAASLSSSAVTFMPPPGYDDAQDSGENGNYSVIIAFAEQDAAGATGSVSATYSITGSKGSAAALLALTPT